MGSEMCIRDSPREAEAGRSEFEASLVYRASFRTARATLRNPVLDKMKIPVGLLKQSATDLDLKNRHLFPHSSGGEVWEEEPGCSVRGDRVMCYPGKSDSGDQHQSADTTLRLLYKIIYSFLANWGMF